MNPYRAYEQVHAAGWTRIDLLLALYDGAIAQLEQSLTLVEKGSESDARRALGQFQLLLSGLVAGVNPDGGELAVNFLRLYDFARHAAEEASAEKLRGALDVLTTLREGLGEIRPEAVRLEREGAIRAVDVTRLVCQVG